MGIVTAAARRAFVWGYATVDLHKVLVEQVLDEASPHHLASFNTWAHARRLADPSDRTIVAMNVDTPYSYGWLDLRAEPVVVELPAFEPGRYMSAMLVDLSTCILGYVSPRTNGTRGGRFVVAGPGWAGETPEGIDGVFRSPTSLALVLLRTQLFDDADMPNVAALQDACGLAPLSAWLGEPAPAAPPMPATQPPVDVRAGPSAAFFDVLAWMLRFMPPIDGDIARRGDLATLGIVPGTPYAPAPEAAAAVLAGMAEGLAAMGAWARTITSSGQIFGSREFFAGDDMPRACGAMLGILGNAAEEYLGIGWQADANGEPFTGERAYTIRFGPPEGFPPVDAFWSITLYDEAKGLYANAIDRYVINTRGAVGLVRDPDGGVTILVGHMPPPGDRLPNWLPSPAGPFGLTFRTYLPREAIRTGAWTAPPVRPLPTDGDAR